MIMIRPDRISMSLSFDIDGTQCRYRISVLSAAVELLPLATLREGAGRDGCPGVINTLDDIEARQSIGHRVARPGGGLCVVKLEPRRAGEGVAWDGFCGGGENDITTISLGFINIMCQVRPI